MKKYSVLLLVAVAFIGSSCSDFLNVNEKNPNNASVVSAELILPGAMKNLAATMNNPRRFDFVYLWYGQWSISQGYSQPVELITYKLLNSSRQNAFQEFYTIANNLDIIEKGATDPKDAYYAATSKILKAYIFQNLVDCWGNVPYSECFQAPANMKPKYDDQQSIYEDLVVQLDAAIALIQNAPANAVTISGSSDIMFAGNMDTWAKFANTLKLRILVHQADMAGRGTYIANAIATTAAVGYLGAGEGGLVNPGFLVSDNKMNPFYETFYNAAGTTQSDGVTYYFAGKDAVDFLLIANDPRISKFFNATAAGNYAGNIFGTKPKELLLASETSKLGYILNDDNTEDPGTMIGTAKKSAPLMTDFEALFIQAEAAQRGLIVGDAKALYESAVTQSFVYMGLPSGVAVDYLSQTLPTVSYADAPNKLQLILTQKWAALNGIAPVEIWTDYRRTGYPNNLHFSPEPSKSGPGTPPVRLPYPQLELSVNNENVLAVGVIDPFTSKIFWQNR